MCVCVCVCVCVFMCVCESVYPSEDLIDMKLTNTYHLWLCVYAILAYIYIYIYVCVCVCVYTLG